MNDKYVDFQRGTEGIENHGKQESAKAQAIRNCFNCAESIMVKMLRHIVGKVDAITYAEFAHVFEAWKEEKDNL